MVNAQLKSLEAWLRLRHTRDVGVAGARALQAAFGDLETALAATPAQWQASALSAGLIRALQEGPDQAAVERDLEWCSHKGNTLLALNDPRYPPLLAALNDAPTVLYVRGDVDVLNTVQLAVVGSRNPTRLGVETAQGFAEHLAGRGLTITSGMALGIDAAAHRGALDGAGLTVAVAATGLDRVYPAQHRELASRILEEGAIVSEFPAGTAVHPEYFPRRNRIVSGLSIGTLVVEAALRSGSLTTARHAMEQGREVLAIPGSIHSPTSKGCHALIKQGAKLVESSDDILSELATQIDLERLNPVAPLPAEGDNAQEADDAEYSRLLQCLSGEAQTIDELIGASGLSAAEVASMLLMLELQGQVIRADGGKYIKRMTDEPAL